tara:strand:- start:74 stop:973 length:900 start_codon:yes stop_codon:yes gene_type:complete
MRNELKIFFEKNINQRNFFITGDLGYNIFDHLIKKNKNFLNIGVCEQSMISFAAGLSNYYEYTYVYSIGNFLSLRPLEQIRNDVCYHNKKICLISVGAGFSYSKYGYSHYCIEDAGILGSLQNIHVFTPFDISSLRSILKFTKDEKILSYIRIGNILTQRDNFNVNIDKKNIYRPNILLNKKADICIVSIGRITSYLYDYIHNKKCDLYFICSNNIIDEKYVTKIFKKYKKVCLVDEHVKSLSIERNFNFIKEKITSITINDNQSFGSIGSNEFLIEKYMKLKKKVDKFLKDSNKYVSK